jgi:hypothetical protein
MIMIGLFLRRPAHPHSPLLYQLLECVTQRKAKQKTKRQG